MIGTLAETDLGKKRIVHICTDRGDQAKKILPALTNMLDMSDTETVMNAAGTMGTLVRLYYTCLLSVLPIIDKTDLQAELRF